MAAAVTSVEPKIPCKEDPRSTSFTNYHFNEVTFTCNICNQSVKSAMFLSCLHSFCAECVDEKLKAEYIVDAKYYTAELCIGQPHLTCPLCPDYDNLSVKLHSNPLPQLITSLKAIRCKVQNDEVLECQDCVSGAGGKPAVSYCVDCNAMICELDLNSHKKYRMGHCILDLEHLRIFTLQQMLDYLRTILLASKETTTTTEIIPQGLSFAREKCIQEARDKIFQLEASKLKLENKWDSQVRQVVTLFEDLQKGIEQMRATLLQELSDLYQELMSPLEKRIQHLEQTISYTQYIAALKNYDYITGLQGTPDYKLSNISDTVANIQLPLPSYIIHVNQHDTLPRLLKGVKNFLSISKENSKSKECFLFKDKRSYTMTLNKSEMVSEIKVTAPVAIAIDKSAQNIYILFDSYINLYELVHMSLFLKRTFILQDHKADISHSAMAVTTDSIVILISNHIYLYSRKDGTFRNQLLDSNHEFIFTYPKMYYFPQIHQYFYVSTLKSSIIYNFHIINGTNQESINYSQNIPNIFGYTGYIISLIDLALCPTNFSNILIFCSCYQQQQQNSAPSHLQQATYYIQIYTSGMSFLSIISLNQKLSPFCCFIPRKDELYLLDAATGQISVFNTQNYVIHDQNRNFSRQIQNRITNIPVNKIRTEYNSFNKAIDLEGKLTTNYPIQAFLYSNEHKIILFYKGNIQIITI